MLRHTWLRHAAVLLGSLVVPRIVRSETYLSTEEAQRLLFPGAGLHKVDITLTADQKSAVEKASGERVRHLQLNAWKAADGSWFIVDEVLGKHQYITYAIALSAAGAVKGIEVLVYRETYGHEIKLPKWRAQFHGKTAAAPLKIDGDIKNISGATLSCVHVTDGVRRILQTHAIVLKAL